MVINWDYFIGKDGRLKFKRMPKPKRTVNISDVSDNPFDAASLKNMMECSKNLDEYNKYWKEDYSYFFENYYEVEIEEFGDYFDRNINNFLGELKFLQGNYFLVEGLFYWWKFNGDDGEKGSIEDRKTWKIFRLKKDIKNAVLTEEEKIFLKFIELGFIETNTTNEKKYLYEFIKDANVQDLNYIAIKNNIVTIGKKQDKLNALIKAVADGLIKNTLIDIYRPTKIFDKWFNGLQVKYIETIEQALETFKYPEIYIASVWREVIDNNAPDDFQLIKSVIEMRQKKYLNLLKEIDIKKKAESERLISSGEHLTINSIYDVNKEKIKKANVIVFTDNVDDATKKKYEEINNEIQEERLEEFKIVEERKKKVHDKYKSKKNQTKEIQEFYKYLTIFAVIFFILVVLNFS